MSGNENSDKAEYGTNIVDEVDLCLDENGNHFTQDNVVAKTKRNRKMKTHCTSNFSE